jgi:hypothetical protein
MPAPKKQDRIRYFLSFLSVLTFSVALDARGTLQPGIRFELNRQQHLSLHITLKSGAKASVKVPRHQLPWSGDALVIVAVRGNGQCLKRNVPVDDPLFREVLVEPDIPAQGEIDLEMLFPEIRRVLQGSDVQLFWAYNAPDALNIGRWSGGWLLIEQEKTDIGKQ